MDRKVQRQGCPSLPDHPQALIASVSFCVNSRLRDDNHNKSLLTRLLDLINDDPQPAIYIALLYIMQGCGALCSALPLLRERACNERI